MGVIEFQMRTHSREDVTNHYPGLNNCILHRCNPAVTKIVAGRQKDVHYVITCKSQDCLRMTDNANEVEQIWNKWNPKMNQ
jgi:hypothetical protein